MNCFVANYDQAVEGVDVIIHAGCTYTGILVIGKDQNIFFRELDKGNDDFIHEIMKRENINYMEASNNIFDKGIHFTANNESNNESSTPSIEITDRNIINDLTDDIRKTLRYYLKNHANTYFKNFYLSGGMAKLIGLKEQIEESLQISIEYLNPFNKIECKELPDNYMQYSIAAGLAIRGLVK